jgi:hypothetical protein
VLPPIEPSSHCQDGIPSAGPHASAPHVGAPSVHLTNVVPAPAAVEAELAR